MSSSKSSISKKKTASSVQNESPPGSSSVDFVLRTALERASGNKRPIRPKLVDASLLGSDSDDSDFQIDEIHHTNSDATGSSDSDSNSNSGDSSSNSGSDSSDDDKDSKPHSSTLRETLEKLNNEEKNGLLNPNTKKRAKKRKGTAVNSTIKKRKTNPAATNGTKKKVGGAAGDKKVNRNKTNPQRKARTVPSSPTRTHSTVMDRVHEASNSMNEIRKDIELKRRKSICSVCLGERSDTTNEIVECDSCHVTVHEGCYSVGNDNLSDHSGDSSSSSASTEPWFCDYCKCPNGRSSCVLCPNTEGLLKQTVEGQFMHVICSIYIPKILRPDGRISLATFPYTQFGQKPCELCTNSRLAVTGATLSCDAGLCKLYFHITCAQKAGLLSCPNSNYTELYDESGADPHFVSCKRHVNKDLSKERSKLYKVLQEQIRLKREEQLHSSNENECRILEKLEEKRAKSSLRNYAIPPSEHKRRRNLITDPYSVTKFLRKIEIFDEDLAQLEAEEKNNRIVSNISKKWSVLPSLTLEFAAYYYDREGRIERLSSQVKKLTKSNYTLNDKQIALNSVLDSECDTLLELSNENLEMDKRINSIKSVLKCIGPGNPSINKIQGLKPSAYRHNNRSPTNKNKIGAIAPCPRLVLNKTCATCRKSSQQHLITVCDACKKYFHLGCLDPPLTRMPKRTKLCGWMCSDCCDDEIEANETQAEEPIILDGPRSLRGRTSIKRPAKYRKNSISYEDSDNISNFTSPQLRSPSVHVIKDLSVQVEQVSTMNGTSSGPSSAIRNRNSPRSALTSPASANTPKLKKAGVRNGKTSTTSPGTSSKSRPTTTKSDPIKVKRSANSSTPTKPQSRRGSGSTVASSSSAASTSGSPPVKTTTTRSSPSQIQANLKIVLSSLDVGNNVSAKLNSLNNGTTTPSSNSSSRSTSVTPSNSVEDKSPALSTPNRPPHRSRTRAASGNKDSYSRSLSGQMVAAINYSSTMSTPSTASSTGLCAVCSKLEHKRNLVQCDDCGLDYHFMCVEPFTPYNPKRRGYSWNCSSCKEDEGDDDEI